MISTRNKLAALSFAAAATLGTLGIAGPAALAQAAPISAPRLTAAPTAGELKAKMGVLFNINAPRSARAAELETGEAGLRAFDAAAALIAIAPPSWRWDIPGPVTVTGDTAAAGLVTTTEGYEPWTFDLTWKQIGGTWKLSHESVCTIGNFVGTGC
ncbi:hypothetical protein [Nocardia carnea]|uniref:hypothetical protein n=1 Tax=Nocardia carnea TaxID=37328 RepID=UPI00245782A5|nr:hypothetical protein [Nocardia carnea]